jgi:hypothetical protein
MNEVLPWEEIERRYPDEWVLLADPELDEASEVRAGRVLLHAADGDFVHERARELRLPASALLFTGEPAQDIIFAL